MNCGVQGKHRPHAFPVGTQNKLCNGNQAVVSKEGKSVDGVIGNVHQTPFVAHDGDTEGGVSA